MTSCSNARENISAYIDNELSIDERHSFEKHIGSCKECKNELDEMTHIVGLCANLPQQELPVDFKAELHEKLLAVADRQKSNIRSIKKSKSFLFTKTFASIAAGMLLIFLAGSLYKFGLFSPMKSQDKSNSIAMAAEQPAAAKMEENSDTFATGSEADNAGVADKTEMGFSAAAADDAAYFDVDRSATAQDREAAIAGSGQLLKIETAGNKLSTITISADNPDVQAEKVRTLALENNGEVVDKSANLMATTTTESTDQAVSIQADTAMETTGALTQTELNFIIPDTQYDQFITGLNTTFGEANVQKGAFVTEDMTEVLNSYIARSNEIDNRIQELQKKDSTKNSSEINDLKAEKEAVNSRIDQIRLGTDFVNVTVYIITK